MAGFEVVVRPAVFPNIRPQPAQSLPPEGDSEQGFTVIRGNGAKQITISNSWSSSASSSQRGETQRRVDVARVYQQNNDGSVNRDNFVDLEIVNKIWMKGASSASPGFNGDDYAPSTPGRGFTGDDIVPKSQGGKADEVQVNHYSRAKAAKNIEIMERDRIVRGDDR